MEQEGSPSGLFAAIGEQAERERNEVLAGAEARAREILAAADAEAGQARRDALSRMETELRADADRLLGEARMDARNEKLAMKRRLLAEAYTRARQELTRRAGSPEQRRALEALAAEALGAAGEGGTVQTAEAGGSVIARSRDARTVIDNGLLSRLDRAVAREEAEVARLLFAPRDAS